MLLDQVFYDKAVVRLVLNLLEHSAELEEAQDLAYMVSFSVVISIFLRNDERERVLNTLDADAEVKEGHV